MPTTNISISYNDKCGLRHSIGLLLLTTAVVLTLAPAATWLHAQEAVRRDTILLESEHFSATKLIIPTTLFTVGAIGVNNGYFCSLKNEVRDGFEVMRGDHRMHFDDYLQYLPVASYFGLDLCGVRGDHNLREQMAAAATAYIVMAALVNGIKYTVQEPRPGSGARNSFPSGHTATAITGAELIRLEYGNGYGAAAYGVSALGVAFMRLYNDRHWLNDIVAGAGIGILSANIGYWLLPWERRLLGWDKDDRRQVALVPTYNATYRNYGFMLTAQF